MIQFKIPISMLEITEGEPILTMNAPRLAPMIFSKGHTILLWKRS